MREQADREAQLILREARGEAERIVDASRSEIRKLESELVSLDKSRVTYIAQLRAVIERQLAELGALHAPQPPQPPQAPQAAPQAPAAPAPAPAAPPAPAPATRRASTEGEAADTRGHVKTPAWLESLVKE